MSKVKAGTDAEKHELLTTHKLTQANLDDAQKAGFPWALILQLLTKYGPEAWQIIQDIINHKTPPTPVPFPTPTPKTNP